MYSLNIFDVLIWYWPRKILENSLIKLGNPKFSDLNPWSVCILLRYFNLVSDGSVSILSNCEKCNLFLVFEIIFENVTFRLNHIFSWTEPFLQIWHRNYEQSFCHYLTMNTTIQTGIQFSLNRYSLEQCNDMSWQYTKNKTTILGPGPKKLGPPLTRTKYGVDHRIKHFTCGRDFSEPISLTSKMLYCMVYPVFCPKTVGI